MPPRKLSERQQQVLDVVPTTWSSAQEIFTLAYKAHRIPYSTAYACLQRLLDRDIIERRNARRHHSDANGMIHIYAPSHRYEYRHIPIDSGLFAGLEQQLAIDVSLLDLFDGPDTGGDA